MKFSMESTFNDIMKYPQIKEFLPLFYPCIFLEIVPEEKKDDTLFELEKSITMPWGAPYLSDLLVDAANIIIDIVERNAYNFIPLWGNSMENICLITSNEYKNALETRPAVIICPGGGYRTVATTIEGIPVLQILEQKGYQVFILNYRVAPYEYPEPQLDLMMAVKYLRSHADKYNIDPEDITIMGFSAGGHLCSSTAALTGNLEERLKEEIKSNIPKMIERYEHIDSKPNKVCLCYPVISFQKEAHEDSFLALTGGNEDLRNELSVDRLITENYPKTYIWACKDDDVVPVSNSIRMHEALESANVINKFKIFPTGGHGIGLAINTSAESWLEDAVNFLKRKKL